VIRVSDTAAGRLEEIRVAKVGRVRKHEPVEAVMKSQPVGRWGGHDSEMKVRRYRSEDCCEE